jgi:uncharacterized protein (TIGR02147 family)
MVTPTLPQIFDYLDCVKFLRDYYEARHAAERWFSYRYIQRRAGVDPGFLYKVFQGKKTLPAEKAEPLARALGLNARETEYFNLLVLYSRARSNDEIKLYFEKLLSYRELATRKVDAKKYEYYTKWYYAAVRQILSYHCFKGDYQELAKMTVPEITVAEAKKAINLLCTLGFLEKAADGTYRVTDRFLSTGEEWRSIAIRNFQRDTIMLAHKALDDVHKDQRDISTVTITLSEDGFGEARELIRQFRRDMLELADRQAQPSGAYHVNIQMIPIGRKKEGPQK